MATLTNTLNAEFTPAVGDFNAQASAGRAILWRKQTASAAFVEVGRLHNNAVIVSNPVAGAVYKFTATDPSVQVQADQ